MEINQVAIIFLPQVNHNKFWRRVQQSNHQEQADIQILISNLFGFFEDCCGTTWCFKSSTP